MKPPATPFSRRQFLRTSTLSALAASAYPHLGLQATSPATRLQHACIGVGGMGWPDLQAISSHPRVQIVALCDVDHNHLNHAAKAFPEARTYTDWRELLDQEGDRIDSLNVTVPDHMHFPIALRAIQSGKHVFCQKPMCHDVAEVRALTEAAARKGVVTQLGTQMASGAGDRVTVELLRSGAIGKIQRAVLCSNRPGAIEHYRLKGPRPPQGEAPPAHLDWDRWLGNAPERPYASDLYHPVKWRAWLDFGTGWSGDIGCHILDAVWKGLDLKAPRSVIARVQDSWQKSPERRADTWPQSNHITWTFPGNALTAENELPVEWFDGEFYPPDSIRSRFTAADYPTESVMVVGTEGALLNGGGSLPYLLPEEKFRNHPRPRIPSRNHYHHFIDACLGGEATECNFSISGPMTETVLLGTVAVRVPDQQLDWEPQTMRFPNHPAAERLLRRDYRAGWEA
jgi:predicted dehydrogenase